MKEYFECSCNSSQHTLKFEFDDDKELPLIYVSIFLSEFPWYMRLFEALKYVFGYKCRYGHFDEFILKKQDCDRLIDIIVKLKDC